MTPALLSGIQPIRAGGSTIQPDVLASIQKASANTGMDFSYLMAQASRESSFDPSAKASTSSATGLYQFVEQSWLGVVKEHGAEHGMGWAADAITRNASGRYVVRDPAARQAILGLRNDPTAASLMAAEHASDNKDALESSLGRPATGTDLYMAHFLGLGGARSFLNAMEANPGRSGASMFPAAARANRNIFFNSNGQPRSLSEIYARFGDKLDAGAAANGATGLASSGGSIGLTANPAIASISLDNGGEVVLGNGASDGDESWINSTLANIRNLREPVNPMRPTPDTARLAYLMLARLGA